MPLEARILSVADAYEAMTHDRVYRPALGPGAAWRELEQGAGSQFDEEVVEAFHRVLKAEGGARGPRPVDLRPRLERERLRPTRHVVTLRQPAVAVAGGRVAPPSIWWPIVVVRVQPQVTPMERLPARM